MRGPVDTLAPMTAEFNWWLLLLGLVVGGGLTWLVLADTRRREQDLEDDELTTEAAWLEARLAEEGRPLSADTLEHVVRLHRAYLSIEPPDEVLDEEWRDEDPAAEFADPWQSPTSAPDEAAIDDVEPVHAPPPATPDEHAVHHQVRGG